MAEIQAIQAPIYRQRWRPPRPGPCGIHPCITPHGLLHGAPSENATHTYCKRLITNDKPPAHANQIKHRDTCPSCMAGAHGSGALQPAEAADTMRPAPI